MTIAQRTVIIERVKAIPPLTTTQMRVVECLEAGLTPKQTGAKLGISHWTVNFHIKEAAVRIPGDLPSTSRLIAWFRGAPLYVLERLNSTQSRHLREALDKTFGNGNLQR